ncbi:hypothetical protein COCNU_02G008430 [Cocos nucifera]|uniref:GDT1 family protein n=1 Tax=Cocos nucifera TaxID=13894 RepID=A0A8K0MWJ6_COCNU|nr:hypothetical protein COCNU_02G008430 [Cocos nucifera]
MDQLIMSSRCRMSQLALLLLLVSISASGFVLAQELEMEEGSENTSTNTVGSLDRRTKMFLHSFKKDVTSEEGVISLRETGLGLFDAFFSSLSMIIVSEIGDETFIIAALMAMRHPKTIVLSGALTALIVMTVLSTGLGRIVPNLISRKHTNSAATGFIDLKMGEGIHGWLIRNGVQLDAVLQNSILDFYAESGASECSERVFGMMDERETVSWNIVIGAHLQNGDINGLMKMFKMSPRCDVSSWKTIINGDMHNGLDMTALQLLFNMVDIGLKLNPFTFFMALVVAGTLAGIRKLKH